MDNNIWQYILFFVILFYVINNSEVENKVIVSCLVSFVAIYLYYIHNTNTNVLKDKKEIDTKVLSNKPNNYRFVSKDKTIIDLMRKLKHIKKFNKPAYNEALKHLDNLLRLKEDITHGIGYSKHNCEVAIDERKKALNALSSLVVNCPNMKKNIYENQIIDTIKKIELETYNYLYEVVNVLNQEWESGNVDISSGEIVLDEPRGFDIMTNKNYDLYN